MATLDDDTIDELVDKKNQLIRELNDVLELLHVARVDLVCDNHIRHAVQTHPALDLKD